MRLVTSKKVKISLVVIASLFFIFLILGELYFSKTAMIERYVAVRRQKTLQMADVKPYLVWADTKNYITFDEAKYATFSSLSDEQAKALTERLKVATEDEDMFVTVIGKRFGLFSDYRIAMKPFRLTIKTNMPQMDILLNRKKVITSQSDDFTYTLERLPLADYEATLSGLYQNKRLQFSKKYNGQVPEIDLSVQFKSFSVASNLTDGDLMIGKAKVATLSDGRFKVEQFPMTEDTDVFVAKTFQDGTIESNHVQLSQIENDSELTLTVEDLLSQEEAGSYLLQAFEQFATYISTKQDPLDLSLFESGANNGFYRVLKKSVEAKLLTDGRLASSLSLPNIWLNSLRQVGKESYAIDYGAVYTYYYDKATDPSQKTQGYLNQTIDGVAILKTSGDGYIFQSTGNRDVTVIAEENKVKPVAIFPDGVVGTWETKLSKEKARVTLTISEDGTITKVVTYDNANRPATTYVATVGETIEVGSGIYRYSGLTGDMSTLVMTSGIGGDKVKYDYGFQVQGGQLLTLIWQAGDNADFDYSKPLSSTPLTKK